MTPSVSDDDDLAELRVLLEADRRRTTEVVDSLARNLESIVDAARSTSTDDEHDPEGSTIAFERSQTSALLASANVHLADVDEALSRIAAGDYGRCERCGQPIHRDRLLARPAARRCIRCAV